jgi:NADPH:quinone reductase-like Zn-dependent oxidoreductase
MKAIICTKYGPPEVLAIKDVEKPTPKDDEVCIKIHAAGVTQSDIYIRGSQFPLRILIPFRLMMGITKPRKPIMGLVFAGEIESAGKDTKRFKPGDQVYGLTGFSLGAYAEYKCMKETDSVNGCLSFKPGGITYEEATVAAYGGLLALQFADKGNIQSGQNVFIYGASGTTGTIAIQYARFLGAKVTAACSGKNKDLVKSLGAEKVIDYTTTDKTEPGINYDFILDAAGKRKTSKLKKSCRKALAQGGKYVSIDDESLQLDSSRLALIKELIEVGSLKTIIDKCYPFEEVIEAHRYVEKGHKTGGVVLKIVC